MLRSINEQLEKYFERGLNAGPFSDNDLALISTLLRNSKCERYSRVPRLYTILRMIGYPEVLDEFIDLGITDLSVPFNKASFPSGISAVIRSLFLEYQRAVSTEVLAVEKGEEGRHWHFEKEEQVPYQVTAKLGYGSYGNVEKIVSSLTFIEYARKTLTRTKRRTNEALMKSFVNELQILRRLQHKHCVEMVGSYTTPKMFALILSPVADSNLASYMADAVSSSDKKSLLRTFFGCLCRGLQYLHDSNIRHIDVKPSNILVRGASVLWADFGISLDWTDLSRSTTTRDASMSLHYCAPEVAHSQSRNSSSDIWSLGCVFMEMATILKGSSIPQMRQSFEAETENHYFYANIGPVNLWMKKLRNIGSDEDNQPLKWIISMLNVNPGDRPKAERLFDMITYELADPEMFCRSCCLEDDDSSISDGEPWTEGPEEQRTFHRNPLPFNLIPSRAPVDQHSANPKNSIHLSQDPGQGPSNAVGNSIFPNCDNNNNGEGLLSPMDIDSTIEVVIVPENSDITNRGCDNIDDEDDSDENYNDENSSEFSPRNSVEHLHSTHIDLQRTCVFPDCDNNEGKGFSSASALQDHVQSIYWGQRSNSTFPGRNNKQGVGLSGNHSFKRHVQSIHLGKRSNCNFHGCGNNNGKGFTTPSHLKVHVQSIHLRQRYDCTIPGCDNNYGKGFASTYYMNVHLQSVHLRQRSNCTFPGCENNDGKGFLHAKFLQRHVQSIHSGQKSACTFHGCDNNKGEGFSTAVCLENHVQSIHLGQRYNCTISGCDNRNGKGFSQAKSLQRHVKSIHLKQKSDCTVHGCDNNKGEGFSTAVCLKSHLQSIHLGQRYNCTISGCDNRNGNGYKNMTHLQRHMRGKHFDPLEYI